MPITLPQKLEDQIQEKVSSGAYASVEEVVEKGLVLLQEQEELLDSVRAKIQVGADQLKRGEGIDGKEVFAKLRDKYNFSAQ
ncbi:type II toxin-antitoxin system ParD family antitoxin [Terasakiella sp. SH-1]|uniref:ribbon-helix-helix domain-containing protein n=1 Tax=Terasakiella sp. SH-1 TaxID=2560057 RepID=UPI001430581F|nr:type II toxin-antitoxin system ParD family antitoxin [Terasakiella sp. SH-1]